MADSENSFVRVVENENVGRSYFANENLPMGTKILSEIPFGCVLINETVLEGNAHGSNNQFCLFHIFLVVSLL